MLSPINLDDKAKVVTDKVQDISAERDLPAETQSVEPVRPQGIPKLALRPGHLPAE
jgi:hypothetical protein